LDRQKYVENLKDLARRSSLMAIAVDDSDVELGFKSAEDIRAVRLELQRAALAASAFAWQLENGIDGEGKEG
jgi:hypothetical protein